MQSIETIATVAEDGTIMARGPRSLPVGEHWAVIVLEEAPATPRSSRRLGDMAGFRERLGVPTYRGNTVVEMRDEKRC